MNELQREIFRTAESHDGRYLLHRRYGNPPPPDRHYDACAALVYSRHAKWLSSNSDYAPGIRLTGKPITES